MQKTSYELPITKNKLLSFNNYDTLRNTLNIKNLMTIITDFRPEVKRIEHLFENRSAPTIEVIENFPQVLTEKPQTTDMVNAAANSLRSPLLALSLIHI